MRKLATQSVGRNEPVRAARFFLFAFLIFTFAFLIGACAPIQRALYKPTVETIPGNPSITITNWSARLTITNWSARPEVTAGLEAAGSFVPGYGTLAAGALGLASSLYLAWLNRKNKKVGVATIQAIDQFRTALKGSGDKGKALDEKLTGILSKAHWDAGVKAAVEKLIDAHTGSTTAGAQLTEEMRRVL